VSRSTDRLLERLRSFDGDALAEVYDQYAPALYRYAYRLTGHRETAEDIVSEVFNRFLNALKRDGGPETQVSAWLYRVAHNLVVDFYRRQPVQDPIDIEDVILAGREDSHTDVERQELAERARMALQQLTPLQQQIIVLRFLEEMSNEEVAAVVQKTVGAVKALQHRALGSLRRVLEEKHEV